MKTRTMTKVLLGATMSLAISTTLGCEAGDPADDLAGLGGISTQQQGWETGPSPDSPNGSHQWLIARGLEILAQHPELPGVRDRLAFLDTESCRKQLRQGAFDADFLARYSGAKKDLTPEASTIDYLLAGATYVAHFYDPDTGNTYTGKPSPTSRDNVIALLDSARKANLRGETTFACHELGVAAHFFGDMANPMHAALFTSKDFPLYLHSNLEVYTMDIQARYAQADWSETPRGELDPLMHETASNAKALWPDTLAAVKSAYRARNCWTTFRPKDNPDCWKNDPAVDDEIGQSLLLAQDAMARFFALADFGLSHYVP